MLARRGARLTVQDADPAGRAGVGSVSYCTWDNRTEAAFVRWAA
ncbi:hypothetical protein MKK49_03340 [Methylobacterium sp. J-090]|nr:hypothetical protein [Methylobacterium sp. J-090]